jgi:Glycosyl hydrolases family 16
VPTPFPRRATKHSLRRSIALALLALAASAGVASFGASSQAAPQQATITVLPGIVQPGKTVANADKALSAVVATFAPAKKGREVVLQKKSGSKWLDVASGVQDRTGKVEFAAPGGTATSPITYRAVASKSSGLDAIASRAVATSLWGPATFTDQFAGTVLSGNWVHRMQFYQPSSMRNCSKGDPSAVSVAQGSLRLSVLRDPVLPPGSCTAYKQDGSVIGQFDYRLNGHVSTEDHQYLEYGVIAARIKFQRLQGQHASLWMQPQDPTYIPNALQGGAEIDVIEYFGDGVKNGGLTSFIYNPTASGVPQKVGGWIKKPERYLSETSDGWSKRYHVFSVEWSPSAYVFRIDGRETARITTGISGVPEFPILSLLSSDYELKRLKGEANLPQTMNVDWIRFWQAPGGTP